MSLEHIVKHTCRFNIKNPQHRKVNEMLANLNPEVCKSKSQFMIDAAEYYIDHFGKESFVAVPKEKSSYITKAELEELKEQMITAAVNAAKDEMIRIGFGKQIEMTQQPRQITEVPEVSEREELYDDTVSDYASSFMEGLEE